MFPARLVTVWIGFAPDLELVDPDARVCAREDVMP